MSRPYVEQVTYKRRYQNPPGHHRLPSEALNKYVKARAKGNCEGCDTPAPFEKNLPGTSSRPPPRHYAVDAAAFNQTLIEKLMGIEGKKLHLPTS